MKPGQYRKAIVGAVATVLSVASAILATRWPLVGQFISEDVIQALAVIIGGALSAWIVYRVPNDQA